MLLPRLNNCVDCSSIPALLGDIDCKVTEIAKNEYNNTVFMLNKQIPSEAFFDLLQYKRILTYKFCNSNYACNYSVDRIASKVKILIHK